MNPFSIVSSSLKEMFQYRELFFNLVSRELQSRYKGSYLGFLWSLLNPLLMMVVYSVIFSIVMRIKIENYSLYLFAGLLPWTWFSTALSNGAGSIIFNSSLVKKVYLPTELLPVVAVTTNLINFLLTIPILLLFIAFHHVPLTWALLAVPLVIAVQFLFTLGVAMFLAVLNVFFRDIEQLIGVIILVWMYGSPILYSPDMVPEKFRLFYDLNPMAAIIHSYHQIFIHGTLPSLHSFAFPLLLGLVLVASGLILFSLTKFEFAEAI
ncbi:ABC transporter permease [bacterium]|nr:ABC transporter permease [bacterium]